MRILTTAVLICLALLSPRASHANTISLEASSCCISGGALPDIAFNSATFQFDGILQSFSLDQSGYSHYEYAGHVDVVLDWYDSLLDESGSGGFAGNMTLQFSLCEDELAELQGFDCDPNGSLGLGSATMSGLVVEPSLATALGGATDVGSAFFAFDMVSGNPWSGSRSGGTVSAGIDFDGLGIDISDTGLFINGPVPSVPEPPLTVLLVSSLFAVIRHRRRARVR